MNQWAFVVAAYGVTLGGNAAVVLWAWLSMRSAERAARR
jgi:hypothetical protein